MCGAWALACGDSGSTTDAGNVSASTAADSIGFVNFFIEAGNGVAGLTPGKDAEAIGDGWTVEYEQLLYVVGDVDAHNVAGGAVEINSDNYVVDLKRLGLGGTLLEMYRGATAEYERVSFVNSIAAASATTLNGAVDDAKFMYGRGYSIYIKGSISSPDGQSCRPGAPDDCVPAAKVSFTWGLTAPTRYDGCTGFSVDANEESEARLTLPADRWLLTKFTADAEDAQRRAQWIADADVDRDGKTTLDELRSIKAAEFFPTKLGYSFKGSPIPVNTAFDYLEAQIRTVGRDRANGCETSVAG